MSTHYSSPLTFPKVDQFSDSQSQSSGCKINLFKSFISLCSKKEEHISQFTKPRSQTFKQLEEEDTQTLKHRKVSYTESLVTKMSENTKEFRIIVNANPSKYQLDQQALPALTQWVKCNEQSQSIIDSIINRLNKIPQLKNGSTILLLQMTPNQQLIRHLSHKHLVLHFDVHLPLDSTDMQIIQQLTQDNVVEVLISNHKFHDLSLFDCILIVPTIDITYDSDIANYVDKMLSLLCASKTDISDKLVLMLPSSLNCIDELLSNTWSRLIQLQDQSQFIPKISKPTNYQYSKPHRIAQSITTKIKSSSYYHLNSIEQDSQKQFISFCQFLQINAVTINSKPQYIVAYLKNSQSMFHNFEKELVQVRNYLLEQIFYLESLTKLSEMQHNQLSNIINNASLCSILKCYEKIQQSEITFFKLRSTNVLLSYYTFLTGSGIITNDEDLNKVQDIFEDYYIPRVNAYVSSQQMKQYKQTIQTQHFSKSQSIDADDVGSFYSQAQHLDCLEEAVQYSWPSQENDQFE